MLIPSGFHGVSTKYPSLSRRVNANSQLIIISIACQIKLIKKGEC